MRCCLLGSEEENWNFKINCGKKNPARQVSRRPVSGVLVGVRAGRSSTASDQRARGRNLQHRSDYSQVVLSCEEVTTGLGLGVE